MRDRGQFYPTGFTINAIRIISASLATRRERKDYEQNAF
jgi:uncharacterized DUF497 family protein